MAVPSSTATNDRFDEGSAKRNQSPPAKQEDFNREHGIVPQGVKKAVREIIDGVYRGPDVAPESSASDALPMDEKTLSKRLRELEEEMMSYAKNLDFEKAARVREELMALRKQAFGASAPA